MSREMASMSFDRFAPGDVAIFSRSFSEHDFAAFSALSGDQNPLHADADYAASTRFGRPIVPLHMTLAPLSMVAGMIFPGKPSLYLGHEVRAAQPVFYGETLRYSARIESVNIAHRILTLRVLALRETDVVLDTVMNVQATAATWDTQSAATIIHTASPARALVTGASGHIGQAVALALASAGWSLILQDRGADERRQKLQASLDRVSAQCEFVSADLAQAEGQTRLSDALRRHGDVEVVVHAASSPVASDIDSLVATNYTALKRLTEAALPLMLARQKGRIVYVSSTAMIRAAPGWEDYVAAKTMTTGFVGGTDKRLYPYGVRGLSLLPGIVATPFSEPYRGDSPALLPQEVAEAVVSMIEDPGSGVVAIEVGRRQEGQYGFHFAGARSEASADTRPVAPVSASRVEQASMQSGAAEAKVAEVVRRKLRLPPSFDLTTGGLGVTPGWDSLRQIELVLEIEATFGISFLSTEIEALSEFSQLAAATAGKVAK
jgi:short-subunit dehydrogenase/acyl dehydratase/acyl carrier protein